MDTINEDYYINVAETMENELTYTEKKFIELYNNTNIPARKIKTQLKLTEWHYTHIRNKLKPYLNLREKGRQRKQKHKPVNYSYNHSTHNYQIRKNGVYYGSVKSLKEAQRMVELFEANNWDVKSKDKVKEIVLKGG